MTEKDQKILDFIETASGLEGFALPKESAVSLQKTVVSDKVSQKLNDWLSNVPIIDSGVVDLFSQKEPPLPEKAPELYVERADKTEDAVSFFKRVYRPWLSKGVIIYQDELGKLDKKLLKAIRNKLKYKEKISLIVSPKPLRIKKEVRALKKSGNLTKMVSLTRVSYNHT